MKQIFFQGIAVGLVLVFAIGMILDDSGGRKQRPQNDQHGNMQNGDSNQQANRSALNDAFLNDKINKHLQAIEIKKILAQQQIETEVMAVDALNPSSTNILVKDKELHLEHDRPQFDQFFEAYHEGKSWEQPVNVEDQLQKSINQREWVDQYEREYQQAFAEQFVDNAKSNGLEVQLNKELKVIGIRPLQKPEPLPLNNGRGRF